jgi:hypothetical protein
MFIGLSVVCVAIVPQVARAQKDMASCKVVFEAGQKEISTPNHSYITMNLGPGAPTMSESITTGRVRYLRVDGKWMRSPITPQEELTRTQSNIRDAKAYSCHKVRTESVSGITATVYSVHSVTEAGTVDSQVWIANGTGLPLREESQLGDVGSRISTRFDYADVRPPAGVQ